MLPSGGPARLSDKAVGPHAEDEMNLEIILIRSLDHTVVAEVPTLPGVLASALEARGALRAVLALALRVLAERSELAELEADDLTFNFSLDVAGRFLLARDDVQARIHEAVSPEVLEQVAAPVFDPVQNAMGGVQGAVAEALGRPHPQSRGAAIVLETLEAAGWREHRTSTTHRTLRRGQGEELVFPFRDDDVLRNELLHRVGALGGVQF